MKNILVVFTGGTIGSTASAGTINTSGAAAFKLIELFEQQACYQQHIRFTTIQPVQILSENLVPAVWQTVIAAIEELQPDRFDGIIITHGTDTLAYTAAALSFYFNALNIPLLLVSSDYPLDDARANGLSNFNSAIEFIQQIGLPGVFVPYRNQGHITQVHQGSRLTCSLQLTGDFFSVQGHSFMQFENQTFTLTNPIAKSIVSKSSQKLPLLLERVGVRRIKSNSYIPLIPTFSLKGERSEGSGAGTCVDNYALEGEGWGRGNTQTKIPHLTADFSARILMIKPYPGLNYDCFNLDNVDVVLHDLYHSGTACASTGWGDHYSLLAFIARCEKQAIKVYLAPAIQSADAYQSTKVLIEQGATMIWNMSIEAAYIKLMLAYGNFSDERQILAFMAMDVAGEHI